MILHSFDPDSPAVISPGDILPAGHFFDTCVVTFSHLIHEHALSAVPCRPVAEIGACPRLTAASVTSKRLGDGVCAARLELPRSLFYETLSGQTGGS